MLHSCHHSSSSGCSRQLLLTLSIVLEVQFVLSPSAGHTCHELFNLRMGKFDRLPDLVVWPGKLGEGEGGGVWPGKGGRSQGSIQEFLLGGCIPFFAISARNVPITKKIGGSVQNRGEWSGWGISSLSPPPLDQSL